MQKKIYAVFLFVFLSISIFGQVNVQWEKLYGGSQDEIGGNIQQCVDGGYVYIGSTRSPDGDVIGSHCFAPPGTRPPTDAWVVKISATGVLEWQKALGGILFEVPKYVLPTKDTGCIALLHSVSSDGDVANLPPNSKRPGIWMVKFTSRGRIQWQKTFGSSQGNGVQKLIDNNDGTYIISGLKDSLENSGDYKFWIAKIDSVGTILWEKYHANITNPLVGADLVKTSDGFAAITDIGNFVKFNSTGDFVLKKNLVNIGSSSFMLSPDIMQAQGGGFYVLFGKDFIKLDAAGNTIWQKDIVAEFSVSGMLSMVQMEAGAVVLIGFNNNKATLMRFNALGQLQWQKSMVTDDFSYFINGTRAADGSLVLIGDTYSRLGQYSNNHGGEDMWVLKANLATKTDETQVINNLKIYPNPVYDYLKIGNLRFDFNDNSYEITDVTGRRVQTGKVSTSINIAQLERGFYVLSLKNESNRIVGTAKFIKN
jgi:hypothetical protein